MVGGGGGGAVLPKVVRNGGSNLNGHRIGESGTSSRTSTAHRGRIRWREDGPFGRPCGVHGVGGGAEGTVLIGWWGRCLWGRDQLAVGGGRSLAALRRSPYRCPDNEPDTSVDGPNDNTDNSSCELHR